MAVVNDILSGISVNESSMLDNMTSFTEAATYAIEGADYDFDNMLESVGIASLNESVVLTEGFAEFKDAAVAFFQNMWARIKAFFAKVAKWFTDRCAQVKKAFTDLGDKLSDKIEDARRKKALKFTGKISGEIVDAAKMAKDQKEVTYHIWSFTRDMSKELADAFVISEKELTKPVARKLDDEDADEDRRIPGLIVGLDKEIGVGEMRDAFKKDLGIDNQVTRKISEVEDSFIDAATETVINNGDQRAIKAEYNRLRANIKKCIDKVKKFNKEDKDNKYAKAYAQDIKSLKTVMQCVTALCAVEMDCRKMMVAESYRLLNTIYHMGAAELKKQQIKESASIFAW